MIDRVYELRSDKLKIESDEWMAEISYEEKAQYPNQMQVDDHQRVSVVLELFDGGEGGVSPQVAVQAMPAANTMIRLGTARQPIWAPIRIPTG